MKWHMFIRYLDNEVSRMNYTNLRKYLSKRFRELYLRDGEFPSKFEVHSKDASALERHLYFTPKVSELAQDILDTYGAFPVSAPESIENMRQIVL
jgi:hypothetical protein